MAATLASKIDISAADLKDWSANKFGPNFKELRRKEKLQKIKPGGSHVGSVRAEEKSAA